MPKPETAKQPFTPGPCACRITLNQQPPDTIVYCPLHSQAPRGYELAKLVAGTLHPATPSSGSITFPMLELARSIVRAVEEGQ